jgi:hypothetical protein
MAIPDFTANGVLPPHLGSPIRGSQLSPFPATSLELCAKYGFTPERRQILRGWLQMRELLRKVGHNIGFQWIDGSFLEDCEHLRGRPPGDIDVVSFIPKDPSGMDPATSKILSDGQQTKNLFSVHHMIVRLDWGGEKIVEHTRFWVGAFSHRKSDGVWKGMLKIDLDSKSIDDNAATHLDALGKP